MEGEEQKIIMDGEKPKKGKLWLVIVVLVIVIAAAGGYFVFAKKSSDSSSGGILSSLTPKKLNANCKYNDPDLCKFMNNWKDVKYLTMSGTDTGSDGKTYVTVFKMEGDTKSQMITSENSTESYNTITIDKTTYTKDYTDNKWWKYTPKETDENLAKETESEIDFDTKADNTEDKTTYEKMGTEACGKLTCFKYKEIDPSVTDYTQYIYFDNKDYQLRKTRTEMKDGSVSEATYDYAKFSISAPSPTKEGDPYSTGIPASSIPGASTTVPAAPSTYTPSDSTIDTSSPDTSTVPADTTDTNAESDSYDIAQ